MIRISSARLMAAVAGMLLFGATLGASVGAQPASAHGSTQEPASRTYACRFEDPSNPMCATAWSANSQALYDWMEVNIGDANGRHRELIPDGQLCGAGRDKYAAFNQPGAWPLTELRTDGSGFVDLVYENTAPHATAYYRVYLTRPGFDARTDALGWNDLELAFDSGPLDRAPSNRLRVPLPARDVPAILYVVWQRSDSPEAFYACSDVTVNGGAGGPAPTPTPTPTAAPPPTTAAPTTRPPTTPPPTTSPSTAPTTTPTTAAPTTRPPTSPLPTTRPPTTSAPTAPTTQEPTVAPPAVAPPTTRAPLSPPSAAGASSAPATALPALASASADLPSTTAAATNQSPTDEEPTSAVPADVNGADSPVGVGERSSRSDSLDLALGKPADRPGGTGGNRLLMVIGSVGVISASLLLLGTRLWASGRELWTGTVARMLADGA